MLENVFAGKCLDHLLYYDKTMKDENRFEKMLKEPYFQHYSTIIII